MLREYQEEIQKLKSMLDGKDGDITGRPDNVLESLQLVMCYCELVGCSL